MEAGKRWLSGDTTLEDNRPEVRKLTHKNDSLKKEFAEESIEICLQQVCMPQQANLRFQIWLYKHN